MLRPWTLLLGAMLLRRPRQQVVVPVEVVFPPGVKILDVISTADGRGVIVTYDDRKRVAEGSDP